MFFYLGTPIYLCSFNAVKTFLEVSRFLQHLKNYKKCVLTIDI